MHFRFAESGIAQIPPLDIGYKRWIVAMQTRARFSSLFEGQVLADVLFAAVARGAPYQSRQLSALTFAAGVSEGFGLDAVFAFDDQGNVFSRLSRFLSGK